MHANSSRNLLVSVLVKRPDVVIHISTIPVLFFPLIFVSVERTLLSLWASLDGIRPQTNTPSIYTFLSSPQNCTPVFRPFKPFLGLLTTHLAFLSQCTPTSFLLPLSSLSTPFGYLAYHSGRSACTYPSCFDISISMLFAPLSSSSTSHFQPIVTHTHLAFFT